jgi:hypothetical protein
MEISGRAQVPVTLPLGKEISVANGDKRFLHYPTTTHKLN